MSTFRERNQKRKETARTGGISSPSVSSRNSTFSDRFQERKNKMKQEPKSATNLPSLSESILSQDKYRPMTSFAAADKVIASKKTPFLPHVDIGVSEGTFLNRNAFIFHEDTGKITRNEAYTGANALFVLSIDPEKADPEKANAILERIENRK